VRNGQEAASGGKGAGRWLVCLFLLALLLRLANLAWGSLKLDDFHSLHHARAADLRTFFAVLAQDNHPPLSFLLVRGARALFGEAPWALRLPSLAAGLATFLVVWRLGARLPCPRARLAAAFLVAASSLHVELSSDVRMYALLGLASAGLLEALLATLEDGRGAWRIALWTVVGLHAHYHFLYTLTVVGAATLLLCSLWPAYRASRVPVLAAFAAAGLVSAPWYALGFPAQLGHGLAPGGSNATLLRTLEGLKNLVFLNVSVAGPLLRGVGLAASGLLLALLALGLGITLPRSRPRERAALPVLVLAAAVLVPLLTFAAARLSSRAGFEWRYLVGALPALCLAVGVEACATGWAARARRAAVAAVCGAALLVAVPNARDPGEEDYAGAVAWILEHSVSEQSVPEQSGPGDAVVAADWQPVLFPHAIGWQYYAPRLAHGRTLPVRLEYTDDFSLLEPAQLGRHARVFTCLRSLPGNCALLRSLRHAFPEEETHIFGRSVYVHVFTRP
jgi:4-amino-4-deoxy-L-arabinose transferase-like glycosyltransferase